MKLNSAVAIERFGLPVFLLPQGDSLLPDGFAIITPIVPRKMDEVNPVPSPLGLVDTRRFLLMGQPHLSLSVGGHLRQQDRVFEIRNVLPVYCASTLSHWQAILLEVTFDDCQAP